MKKVFGLEVKEKDMMYCKTKDGGLKVNALLLCNGPRKPENEIFISALGVVKSVAKNALSERFPYKTKKYMGMEFHDENVSRFYVINFLIGPYNQNIGVTVYSDGSTYIDEKEAEKIY